VFFPASSVTPVTSSSSSRTASAQAQHRAPPLLATSWEEAHLWGVPWRLLDVGWAYFGICPHYSVFILTRLQRSKKLREIVHIADELI
jgi:hypothetical protein